MKRIAFALLILILFAFPSTAHADVAPPANPPGSNLQPGSGTTQVRMVAETVQIDVKADDSLGTARVTADFTMHNLGDQPESMAARFPITANDGFGNYPEIKDLVIKVNGQEIPYQRANYPDIRYQGKDVPWAEFNITFPVGQDVPIQVSYNLKGSGYMPYTAFYYILETGAGWKDTIGSADIILRLPYPTSIQNVVMNTPIGHAGMIDGNEVRWHFDNFEPGPDGPVQNMQFALVAPVSWQNIIKVRDNATQNPNDSEAWGQLAKAYKGIYFLGKGHRMDAGGEELYQLSIDAYEKCLALNPNDAQWHAGFADLLASRSYWDHWMSDPTADTYRAFKEIQTALQLAPNDPKVLEIANMIAGMFPDGMTHTGSVYVFPWLTQTPTPIPPTPTIVPVLDPVMVSGIYQSGPLTLSNNKIAQLTLTLRPDNSAELETNSENEQPVISTGSWADNGDGTLSVAVIDSNQKTIEIKFNVSNDLMQANEFPAFYGEAGIDMQRLVSATPIPASTETPEPGSTSPAPQSSSPLCGSAALIPLVAIIWQIQKRKRLKY